MGYDQRRNNYYNKNRNRSYREKESLGTGLEVKVDYHGDTLEEREYALEKALSIFKKLLQREGIMQELKDRRYFKSKNRKLYEERQSKEYKRQLKLEKKQEFKRFYR